MMIQVLLCLVCIQTAPNEFSNAPLFRKQGELTRTFEKFAATVDVAKHYAPFKVVKCGCGGDRDCFKCGGVGTVSKASRRVLSRFTVCDDCNGDGCGACGSLGVVPTRSFITAHDRAIIEKRSAYIRELESVIKRGKQLPATKSSVPKQNKNKLSPAAGRSNQVTIRPPPAQFIPQFVYPAAQCAGSS